MCRMNGMGRKSYSEVLVTERTGRADIETFLRELYLDRRWTQNEIADHLGVTRSIVGYWFKRYGISRDDRQTAVAL